MHYSLTMYKTFSLIYTKAILYNILYFVMWVSPLSRSIHSTQLCWEVNFTINDKHSELHIDTYIQFINTLSAMFYYVHIQSSSHLNSSYLWSLNSFIRIGILFPTAIHDPILVATDLVSSTTRPFFHNGTWLVSLPLFSTEPEFIQQGNSRKS